MTLDQQAILNLPDEELYAQIGEVLIPNIGGMPDRVQRVARAGRLWFDGQYANLQDLICPKADVLISDSSDDNFVLTSAIADLIAGLVGVVPAFTVAALVVRKGLTEFCEIKLGDVSSDSK